MTIKQQGGIFGRNPTFNDVDVEGTLTVNGEPISDFGTMAQQDADSVNIDGGAIDGVTLGTNSAVTQAQVDNLNLDGNTISTTNTNGNVILNPDGSGKFDLRADITMPKEANREFSIAQSDANNDGANLTVKAGNGGTGGASVHGGDLLLYAGDTWSGDSNFLSGDVKIYSGGNVVQNGQHGSIYFYVKGTTHTTEAARFNPSGNLAFPSGQGIDFSATSGTGTSELFSDYEEGNWTPLFTDGTNNATMSAFNAGFYTKVGNLVTVSGYIEASSLGSMSGSVKLSGLPFTTAGTGGAHTGSAAGWGNNLNITAGQVVGMITDLGATTIGLKLWDASTGATDLQTSEMLSNTVITINLTYRAA